MKERRILKVTYVNGRRRVHYLAHPLMLMTRCRYCGDFFTAWGLFVHLYPLDSPCGIQADEERKRQQAA